MGSGGFRLVLLVLLGLGCRSGFAAIFGSDTRTSIASRSTAVAVLSSNFTVQGDKIKLEADQMGELLCRDEKFAIEPSLSYSCTGFLVDDDLLVTAGHCMVNTGEDRHETETYCQAYSWLFDYNSGVDISSVPRSNLYGCKEVVYAIREETAPFRDFAVVRLDRKVEGRPPLRIRQDANITAPLTMIGYPFGTPAKLSVSARVLLNSAKSESFVTNLNAFEGNSGSPVMDADGEVVGILTGGTPVESLVMDPVRKCQRYNRCLEDGTGCSRPDTPEELKSLPEFQITGSFVQRIAPVLPFLAPSFLGM